MPLESTIEPARRIQKKLRGKRKPIAEVEISPVTSEQRSMELQESSERLASPVLASDTIDAGDASAHPESTADVESQQEQATAVEAKTIEASGLFVTPKYAAGKLPDETEESPEVLFHAKKNPAHRSVTLFPGSTTLSRTLTPMLNRQTRLPHFCWQSQSQRLEQTR